MKNFIKYSIIVILCIGCFDDAFVTNPKIIDDTYLGRESASTKFVSISSLIVSDELRVTLAVTPGAMYTLQMVNIRGETVASHGFTAGSNTVEKIMDYSKVPNGDYDLTLMDTSGNLTKVPVIIKH